MIANRPTVDNLHHAGGWAIRPDGPADRGGGSPVSRFLPTSSAAHRRLRYLPPAITLIVMGLVFDTSTFTRASRPKTAN